MSASRIFGVPKVKRRTPDDVQKRESVQTQSQMHPDTVVNDNTPVRRIKATDDNKKTSQQEIRRVRARQRRRSRGQSLMTTEQKQRQGVRVRRMLRVRRRLSGILPKNTTTKRILATTVSIPILIWTLPFWFFQFSLWLWGAAALGSETIPIVGWVVPGEEFYVLTWILIGTVGMSSLFYAMAMYMMRGIDCFSGWKTFFFIISITLYMTPLLNLAPWIIVWVLAVIYLQNEKSEEESE